MKTTQEAFEWLRQQEYYQEFIAEVAKANPEVVEAFLKERNLSSMIGDHFSWRDTERGFSTWDDRDHAFRKYVEEREEVEYTMMVLCHNVEEAARVLFTLNLSQSKGSMLRNAKGAVAKYGSNTLVNTRTGNFRCATEIESGQVMTTAEEYLKHKEEWLQWTTIEDLYQSGVVQNLGELAEVLLSNDYIVVEENGWIRANPNKVAHRYVTGGDKNFMNLKLSKFRYETLMAEGLPEGEYERTIEFRVDDTEDGVMMTYVTKNLRKHKAPQLYASVEEVYNKTGIHYNWCTLRDLCEFEGWEVQDTDSEIKYPAEVWKAVYNVKLSALL